MKDPPGRPTHPLIDLDEIEVEIEKLVAGGDGLARVGGMPLFVPRSAPGDRVRVRIVERRPDYGRAEILRVVRPGRGRREPPCPYFDRCGGCDLQHIDDALQVELKAAAALETLRRLGGLDRSVEPEVVSGPAWGYRLRTQLHAEAGAEGPRVGYYARRSHDLVSVSGCPVLVESLEAMLPELPGKLPPEPPRRLDLAAGDGGAITTAPVVRGLPRGAVEVEIDGLVFAYDARCFFQAHRQLAGTLVRLAVGEWEGAGEGRGEAIDLYAGVGLFSLALARRYGRVVAVEGDRVAARYARRNARRNGCENVEVISRAVESFLGGWSGGAERILVDPPSAGLPPAVRRRLVEIRPARLTYVSCHAATLARDLRPLGRAFRIDRLALIDLFPQTGHLEVVAQLAPRP